MQQRSRNIDHYILYILKSVDKSKIKRAFRWFGDWEEGWHAADLYMVKNQNVISGSEK